MTDITAGNDVIIADATGRRIAVGKNIEMQDDIDVRHDDRIIRILVRLEENVRHLADGNDRMDTRMLRLEEEVKRVVNTRWGLSDILFVVFISGGVASVITFLSRLIP